MLALSNIAAYAYSTNLSVCVAILIGLSNRCSKSMQHCTGVCDKWSCQRMCRHGQCIGLQSDVQQWLFAGGDLQLLTWGLVWSARVQWFVQNCFYVCWAYYCTANPCSTAPTSVTNGVVSSACAGTASGSSCNPTCNSGYSLVGTYSCSLGAWSGAPVCSGLFKPAFMSLALLFSQSVHHRADVCDKWSCQCMCGHDQRFELQSDLQQWLFAGGHLQLLAWGLVWIARVQWYVFISGRGHSRRRDSS
jgi:hypothetical protein